ncbi:MAG: hypothetical protein KF832_14895 [Caldilineaceae bacterium]|nr:hypothetical protein [Caldilineaceae bacterium]
MTTSTRTLLFVDDHDLLYYAGLQRRLQPLTRAPHNPVIAGHEYPFASLSFYRAALV